jgi:predicted RNase H-like HicB family nuclease
MGQSDAKSRTIRLSKAIVSYTEEKPFMLRYPPQSSMRYQVFLQSQAEQRFVASVVGIPNLSVEGTTEAEAIANVKAALASQLATGKWVTIEMDAIADSQESMPPIRPAGIFASDPTFDDWIEKLATIRQEANALADPQ